MFSGFIVGMYFWLSDSTNLYQLIPFIRHEELANIMKEIDFKEVPIYFDGTTHVCEAIVVLLYFVNEPWNI